VVGSNKSLTGYAHGLEKKRKMLMAEGVGCSEKRAEVNEVLTAGEILRLKAAR
jgi:hypothetical protein